MMASRSISRRMQQVSMELVSAWSLTMVHNCILYGIMGTIYDRETIVRDDTQRLVLFPKRRGMVTQSLVMGDAQYGHFGLPTGRIFTFRTIADCMIYKNNIYREWFVADNMTIVEPLGLDAHVLIGQQLSGDEADTKRMFGRINKVHAQNTQYHGPKMVELYGPAAVLHQHLALLGSIPDGVFTPQHICSKTCDEGGVKVAVRWIIEGHLLCHGILTELGKPKGQRLQVMGMMHYHYKNGKLGDEWNVYDELSLLMQIKLAQLATTKRGTIGD
ncbi:hypothetical protein LLEC1_06536 [Akanthomyces lecanii]|uniref:SnoaL-like domain-containing protein n=1 Tax=Cordyceps confragosa TaxID=2714763 RepID=A0A179IFB2_CORDF|nr:hypothetical protein LLEC1_06536 [Akanthomyces lecanii]